MWFELKGQQYSQSGASVAKRTALILSAALSLAAAGCGSAQDPNQLPVFPATGKITFKGAVPDGASGACIRKPMPRVPNGQEVIPTAQVRSDGAFDFSSYAAKDGAPAGEYKVTVEWHRTVKSAGGEPTLGPNLLPPQYSKADTSPLTIVIAAGPNQLNPIVLK